MYREVTKTSLVFDFASLLDDIPLFNLSFTFVLTLFMSISPNSFSQNFSRAVGAFQINLCTLIIDASILFRKEVSELQLIKIILQIALLSFLTMVGNGIQQVLHLSIPGSVIGMLLLFGLLSTNIIRESWVREGSNLVIKHLTFFFIPATVGVLDYLHVFSGKGSLLIFIVLLSTLLVMAGSGFTSQWILKRREANHD